MRKFFIIFIFLPGTIFSQVVNVESKRQSNEKGWSGTTILSFDYNSSEQVDWEFSNTSYFQWDNNNWSFLLLNEINFDRAGGIDFENEGYQHLRLSKHVSSIFTSETYLQNQFDPIRKVQNRKLIGTGIRARLYNKNYIGISTFYELEKLSYDVINTDFRISTYLQLDFDLTEKIKLLTTTYIQSKINHFSDFKVSSVSQLNFEVSKKLSFTNNFEIFYDAFPASGINEMSYKLQNGIRYNF